MESLIGKVAKCKNGTLGVIEVEVNTANGKMYKGHKLNDVHMKWQSRNPEIVAESEEEWLRKNLQMEG